MLHRTNRIRLIDKMEEYIHTRNCANLYAYRVAGDTARVQSQPSRESRAHASDPRTR
jgi:hypothetical protein